MWIILAFLGLSLLGCDDAQIASRNLSKAADNFEIMRRVVFYNGISGQYILSIEGLCSFSHDYNPAAVMDQVSVTCKVGDRQYKKHSLGLSDNVTYFSEQLNPAKVGTYHYRVTFKPQTILPDIDFRGSAKQVIENEN